MATSVVYAVVVHDGPGPPDPEPPAVINENESRHEASDPEWSGDNPSGAGKKWYWEQDSPGNPNGGVDTVSVVVNRATVISWGSFYDGDAGNGASDISGGGQGATTYYEHDDDDGAGRGLCIGGDEQVDQQPFGCGAARLW